MAPSPPTSGEARRASGPAYHSAPEAGGSAPGPEFGQRLAVEVAFVEELPGATIQGATLAEARGNLGEAVRLVLEANRALTHEDLVGADVIREPLELTA
jgi:predicted RNase H-like HicB family nuclease